MKRVIHQACKLPHYLIAFAGFLLSSSPSSSEVHSSGPIDTRRVRALFAVPAKIADSGFLRREIAGRMHERLALVKIAPERILDLGCGEGADVDLLQGLYPGAELVGVDASAAMLHAMHRRQQQAMSSMNRLLAKWLPRKLGAANSVDARLICGDFAQLPLAAGCADLVWSNLALHWHPQPDLVFAEWRRALRVDGLLMFSCFGPDTLREIRSAFAAIDNAAHALPFVDMHDFGDMLVNAGFSTPVMDMETITVTYESVDKLLSEVRAFGGNPLLTRPRGLTGRAAWQKGLAALGRLRGADGRIPLTFEVVYGHAFRPASRKTASGESIVRFDLPRK